MPHKDVKGTPSVTQIIDVIDKPFLRFWYGKYGTKECERIKRESQVIGERVHGALESVLRYGTSESFPPTSKVEEKADEILKIALPQFVDFIKTNELVPVCIEPEEPVKSKRYGYQGTPDCIASFAGKPGLVICDWKTSSRYDEVMGIQTSAYAYAYSEEQGWDEETAWHVFKQGLVIRIDKETGKLEPHWIDGLKHYFDVFKHLIPVYHFVHKSREWEIPDDSTH